MCVLSFALFSGEKKNCTALSPSLSLPFLSLSPLLNPPTQTQTQHPPHLDLELRVLVARVLPRLRQQPVVPVDVVRVEPQVALLDVLLDRVARLLGRDLHLGARLLGDLADEVEGAVGVLQGDVVPPGDGLALLLDEDAEVGGGALALR